MGNLVGGEPPLYMGIYVVDIIYFSASDVVECKFESLLSSVGTFDFMVQASLFQGIEFTWAQHNGGHILVHLTRQSLTETLIESLGFESIGISMFLTPYQSGLSIDSILHESCPQVIEMHYVELAILSWQFELVSAQNET